MIIIEANGKESHYFPGVIIEGKRAAFQPTHTLGGRGVVILRAEGDLFVRVAREDGQQHTVRRDWLQTCSR